MKTLIRSFAIALLVALPALAAGNDDLARRQERVASKYSQLEALMLKMAQLEAATNPRQAALLTQAIEQSKKNGTKLDLEKIAALLGKGQLKDAVDGQVKAEKSLEELLKLLQSEDRGERNKSEQEKLKEQIKEVQRMIRLQQGIQGQNEGGGDAKRVAEEQEKLERRAEEFARKLKEEEEANKPKPPEGEQKPGDSEQKPGDQAKPGEEKPGEQKPGEQKPGEQKPEDKPGEQKPGEQKPGEQKPGEQKPGEQKPGEQKPGEPMPGQPMPGDMPPMDGQQPPQDQQQSPKSPVREKIEQAQQRMKAAQQKLEQSQRKEAIEEQQKAREELEKAKAELEKILKQLREEEMERTLQALEARFRKMLEMQVKVFEGTKKLDAIPADERTREADVQAGRLGGDEAKIAVEAEKALQLLSEEGSSVAFPATVEQMTDDMRQVSERLNQGKTDTITQGIEEEIIATLEELLQAMEQAQQKLEEQKKQDQQQQPMEGGQQEQPLVDAIQELKMIKSLQLRVNKRTDRFAKLLQDENDPIGQANTKELLDALDKLGERQRQVFEIVRDIVVGKNK
jgi:hypothetical protein